MLPVHKIVNGNGDLIKWVVVIDGHMVTVTDQAHLDKVRAEYEQREKKS